MEKEKNIELKFSLCDLSVLSIAIYDCIQERLSELVSLYSNNPDWDVEKYHSYCMNSLQFLHDCYNVQLIIDNELNSH